MRGRATITIGILGGLLANGWGGAQPIADDPARLLAAYLRIETTGAPREELRAAELLEGALRQAGLSPKRHLGPRDHPTVTCLLPAGSPQQGGTVVLLHHMDVVPAGEGWTAPAFAGEVREGAIRGRGAIDAKGLGVAHLEAFLALARATQPRNRDLLFVAVAGEENGGAEGTRWLLEAHPELFAEVEVVFGEGGQNRTAAGRPMAWGLEIAQKRPLWLELVARGRGGHASTLTPGSATHELIRALARILDRKPAWRLGAAPRQALLALARINPGLAEQIDRLPGLLATGTPERSLPPGVLGHLSDTLQVTTLSGSSAINVIAPEARARIDGRLLPDTDQAALLTELRALAGDLVEIRVLLEAPPSPPSPTGTPAWKAVEAALGSEAPVLPAFIPGVTDARHFRERGIPAYGFSPFVLDSVELAGIHGPDEHLPLVELERGIDRMTRVLRRLLLVEAGPP